MNSLTITDQAPASGRRQGRSRAWAPNQSMTRSWRVATAVGARPGRAAGAGAVVGAGAGPAGGTPTGSGTDPADPAVGADPADRAERTGSEVSWRSVLMAPAILAHATDSDRP